MEISPFSLLAYTHHMQPICSHKLEFVCQNLGKSGIKKADELFVETYLSNMTTPSLQMVLILILPSSNSCPETLRSGDGRVTGTLSEKSF